MAMTVSVIEMKYGRPTKERLLGDIIADFLKGDGNDAGALEAVSWTAARSADAIAELLEILVEKNIITLKEALRVSGIQHREIRLAKEGDGE